MHLLKVALLLVITLVAMRAVSWGIGWLIDFARKKTDRWGALAANVMALGLFAGFVAWNLAPGESYDYESLAFGVVVYVLCLAADLKWRPWKRRPA